MAVDPALKHRHVKALVRLSAATGIYPECLVLEGIEIIGDTVGGGCFADIFKGRLLYRVGHTPETIVAAHLPT